MRVTFSVGSYGKRIGPEERGIFLHFGEVRVHVAQHLDEFLEFIVSLEQMKKEIEENYNMSLKKFYFTFGFGQEHENHFIVIEGVDWNHAREQMTERFKNKWSFQYTEEGWMQYGVSQQEKFGLTELK